MFSLMSVQCLSYDLVKNAKSSFTIEAKEIGNVFGNVILKNLRTDATQISLNAAPGNDW